jgi:hypothetical protein
MRRIESATRPLSTRRIVEAPVVYRSERCGMQLLTRQVHPLEDAGLSRGLARVPSINWRTIAN